MSFCLPKEFSTKFKDALKSGEIDPGKLAAMESGERRIFFEDLVGKENAREVNAMFESKLLLQDQKRGLVSWAKKVAGISEETRRDLLSKIERMEKVLSAEDKASFLEDLASKKLGTEVTFEQAQKVVQLSKEVAELKSEVPNDAPLNSEVRLAYGKKFLEMQDYIRELKGEGKIQSFKESLKNPGEWFGNTLGLTKSLLSSLDNSFFGRQGIKILYTDPVMWSRAFLKSWNDIGKELFGVDKNNNALKQLSKGIDAMQPIKAEIYSRPNAINGKYEKAKIDIGIASEEAYPSSLPGRLPVFGRLFNASESAFQGAALRLRADYADKLIARAEKFGVDMNNPEQAQGVGKIVNSMTGRGSIGKLDTFGKEINAGLFSIKFLKSNLDTLTAHRLGYAIEKGPARTFARRVAAENLAKIIGSVSFVLFVAEQLNPGSVEFDPRSSRFGKIKIGNGYFDVTGGMGSILSLAARATPTFHNGKLGFWYKSATTGKWTDLTAGKYGQQTALDVVENFGEGKVSPALGLLRDVWTGKNFSGEKVTPVNAAFSLLIPLPVQSGIKLNEAQPIDTPEGMAGLILEGLGLSSSTYQSKK